SLGHEFIHIAPAPRFTRLDRARHRVLGGMVVLGGVGVGRRVAAPDVAAGEAKAEMDPTAADLQAFFAAAAVGFHFVGMGKVLTGSHGRVCVLCVAATSPARRDPIFPGRRRLRRSSRGRRAALGWAAFRSARRRTSAGTRRTAGSRTPWPERSWPGRT